MDAPTPSLPPFNIIGSIMRKLRRKHRIIGFGPNAPHHTYVWPTLRVAHIHHHQSIVLGH
jgi:hypothetical protein